MMPWLSFTFENEKIKELSDLYKVKGIPWLVILDNFGNLIKNEADEEIENENVIEEWLKKIKL